MITKELLKIGLICVAVVFTLTACAASGNYETTTHEADGDFSNITINSSTADIEFMLSSDGICKVDCYENSKEKHSVYIENGTLFINSVNEKKWYNHILNFGTPKVTVFLPKSEYSALTIECSTGNINLPNDFKFESIDISLSTGDVNSSSTADDIKISASTGNINLSEIDAKLLDISVSTGNVTVSNSSCSDSLTVISSTGKVIFSNISCKKLSSIGSTGNITLKNVIADENLYIERSTGDISFESSDAGELLVRTTTGNVSGTLLTDKIFIVNTDTGKVSVPDSTTGGRCEITTNTGNIRISISEN